MSLRTGGQIGVAHVPIINPNNLKVEGWYASTSFEKGEFILPIQEVRDFIVKGLVVNDHDSITHPDDLVRLKETIDIRFEIIGKSVVTDGKRKLGKVIDFAVDEQSYYVQKLYVNPTLLKGLINEQLILDRSQIVEITNKKIIVSEPTIRARNSVPLRQSA